MLYELPADSRFGRTVGGRWGDVEHLLAFIADQTFRTAELVQGAHYTAGSGSKKPYQPQPFRVPRPDDQPAAAVGDTPRLSSVAEIRAFFGDAARYVPEKTHAN